MDLDSGRSGGAFLHHSGMGTACPRCAYPVRGPDRHRRDGIANRTRCVDPAASGNGEGSLLGVFRLGDGNTPGDRGKFSVGPSLRTRPCFPEAGAPLCRAHIRRRFVRTAIERRRGWFTRNHDQTWRRRPERTGCGHPPAAHDNRFAAGGLPPSHCGPPHPFRSPSYC